MKNKNDIINQRNIQLMKENKELKDRLKEYEQDSSIKKSKKLTEVLESKKIEFDKAIAILNDKKKEYEELIADLKKFRNDIENKSLIERWFNKNKK